VRHRHEGNVSIELILLLPVVMLLIFGGLEMARAATLRMALGDGAWRAARYLSVYDPWDEAGAASIVRDVVADNALGGDPASVVVAVSDDGGRSFAHVVTVQAEMDFCPLVPFLTNGCVTLRTEHSLQVEAWP
jgi:Flp pilus assembly protein TadG